MFTQTSQDNSSPQKVAPPKQLDSSKTAFLTQPTKNDLPEPEVPQKMNPDKLAQFSDTQNGSSTSGSAVKEELELLKQLQKQKQEEPLVEEANLYEEVTPQAQEEVVASEQTEEADYYTQEDIVDTGITATALYDYQAAAEDEISFDPDDVITHIEKVGWFNNPENKEINE